MAMFLGFPVDEGEEAYSYPTTETDGVSTSTSRQQSECERMCELSFLPLRRGALEEEELTDFIEEGIVNAAGEAVLMRAKHKAYLMRGLSGLGPGFISLDASRPWMVYWILHSLDLLDHFPKGEMTQRIVRTILSCQDSVNGGFGGGPQQLPHCAPMYASVLSLLLIGTPEVYSAIDRPALYRFFASLKHASGGFRMHDDGEVDARGTYTVIAVASLLNMLTPELSEGVADFAVRCQTYEGGFGGEPWNEAHGGYTFCAFASLVILGAAERADLEGLRRWLCARQMRAEGGFQGRTNKLVDGCYSFWQGGAVALLDYVRAGRQSEVSHRDASGRLVPTPPPQQHRQHDNGNASTAPLRNPSQSEGTDPDHPCSGEQPGGVPDDVSGGGGGGGATKTGTCEEKQQRGPTGKDERSIEGLETPREGTKEQANPGAAVTEQGVEESGLLQDVGGGEGTVVEVGGRIDGGEGTDGEEVGSGLAFARKRLQEYVLMCSQQSDGGLRDKPGKPRDFYHTCYTLSGLSVAQHCLSDNSPVVVGDSSNLLRRTNPVYNIAEDKVLRAVSYFAALPSDHATLSAAKP